MDKKFVEKKRAIRKEVLQLKEIYQAGLIEKNDFEIRVRELLRDEIISYLETIE